MNDWNEQLRKIRQAVRASESLASPSKKVEPATARKPTLYQWWIETLKTKQVEAHREEVIRKPNARHGMPPPPAKQQAHQAPSPKKKIVPAFRPHIDRTLDLSMPDWCETGKVLHHPQYSCARTSMSVRMGLDFGTAFTKVAIRAGADVVLVDWSELTHDQTASGCYVMPGFVCRAPDGEYCWRPVAKEAIEGNLKLPIIERALSDECPVATLAYLALVIRYARAFLYRHPDIGPKLAMRTLRWELNIGCPTKPHERPEVVDRLRKIARTAWCLAGAAELSEACITAAWHDIAMDTGLEAEPGVVPEFVAQIAGYLQSSQVKSGLHALVDVGAATLDVATFNVVLPENVDPSPRIPIFFSAVQPLGTHYLSLVRHSELELQMEWDDAEPVEPADAFAKRHGRVIGQVSGIDARFEEGVARCITNVIDGTRTNNRGDPQSAAWHEGLPIFVTGGGAECEPYHGAIYKAQDAIKKNSAQSSFRFFEQALTPRNLSGIQQEAVARTSVAIGLTEDADSIARVVPHRFIEPIVLPRKEQMDHVERYGDR